MNGSIVGLIIIFALVFIVIAIIVLADTFSGKSVRRKEYELMRARLELAQKLIDSISEECDTYAEIDHPVVSKLKPQISSYYKEERKIRL